MQGSGSRTGNGLAPGTLALMVEKMRQMEDLRTLEQNTLEMWRAMTRYEVEKERQLREKKTQEQVAIDSLREQNEKLRRELMVREAVMGFGIQQEDCACCCRCCCGDNRM